MPEYTIIGEPTDNIPVTGCKGLLEIKINTKGIKVHSSNPDKGKSANSNMIKLLYELEEFYKKIHTAGYMTEASFFEGNRIILGVGPMTAHEVNEHVSIENLEKTVEHYKDIINKVCM